MYIYIYIVRLDDRYVRAGGWLAGWWDGNG